MTEEKIFLVKGKKVNKLGLTGISIFNPSGKNYPFIELTKEDISEMDIEVGDFEAVITIPIHIYKKLEGLK